MRSEISSEGERFSHADFETGSRWSRRLTNRRLFGLNDFCVSCASSKLLRQWTFFVSEISWMRLGVNTLKATTYAGIAWFMNESFFWVGYFQWIIGNSSQKQSEWFNRESFWAVCESTTDWLTKQLTFLFICVICYEFGIKHINLLNQTHNEQATTENNTS